MAKPTQCTFDVDAFAFAISTAVAGLPDGFHGSFAYTRTGDNLCHPVTLGLLAKLLIEMNAGVHIGIDVRLNAGGGTKFQPDLVAFDASLRPTLFVDYESPNSSDARILPKDVDPYLAWRARSGATCAPYIVITTLPNRTPTDWEFRYGYAGQWNEQFMQDTGVILQNPFRFWYAHYRQELAQRDVQGLFLINIDDRKAVRCFP